MRKKISETVVKYLYAKSGNKCAFPNCDVELTYVDHNASNMAHIVSENDGPRHELNYNNGNYDVDENLILLCNNHHSLVDSRTDIYTIEFLRNMKNQHENYIKSLINKANINNKFVYEFFKIIYKYEIPSIIEEVDFNSPFSLKIIENLEYCCFDIKQILNSFNALDYNKVINNDIILFKDNINEIINYLVDKVYINNSNLVIPIVERIDKQFILELREETCNIIKRYNNN